MNRLRKMAPALALVAMALGPIPAIAGQDDDTLVIAFTRELTNLDYNFGTKTEYIILGDLIDDSLFYVDPETLEYVPSLATDFTIVDDVTIDINLRENVTFHDGTPMTADDVVYTYNFTLTDDQNSRHAKIAAWLSSVEKTGD
ncbi:MAG: hypothetical protein JKX69_05055 [Rhodobacteraceae bacterium]|nr:hypothetical protein [Paracoccaceae bacterium]